MKKRITLCIFIILGIIGIGLIILFNNIGILDKIEIEDDSFWNCWLNILPLAISLTLVQYITLAILILVERSNYFIISLIYTVLIYVLCLWSLISGGMFQNVGFFVTIINIIVCILMFGLITIASAIIALPTVVFSFTYEYNLILASVIYAVLSFFIISFGLALIFTFLTVIMIISIVLMVILGICIWAGDLPDAPVTIIIIK